MIISFFPNKVYTTGVDYSKHSECIYQEDIDFDPNTQIAELEGEEGNFSVKISEKIPEKIPENEKQKFARVFEKLKSSTNLMGEDLEGVVFDDKQIGDLILERVFDGNPHAEIALQAKVLSMMISGQLDAEKMKQMYKVQEEINEIREFFGLKRI